MKSIQIGDSAPDITLISQDGKQFNLATFRGKQPVVLFFYPKDNTTVCTREACSFRDSYEQFVEAGAVVIGVSGDSPASHRDFAETNRLPYLLVSDSDGSIRRAFGVPKTFGIIPGRVTYVIDRQGIVRNVFRSQLQAERHMEEALESVRALKDAESD